MSETTMQQLAKARFLLAAFTDEYDQARRALEQSDAWLAMVTRRDAVDQMATVVVDLERQVREEALAAYRETGNHRPLAGVVIKMFDQPQYDIPQALAWCVAHAPKYVTLDRRNFEKAAVVLQDLGAPVTMTKESKAYIDRDLSAYLEPASEPVSVEA